MHDKMMKMLMKKKQEGKGLSDSDKKAKLEALGGMRDMAHQMMGSKLKNLKKVTVASDSKPGLKEGLQKAEGMLDKGPEGYSEGGDVDELPDHKNPPKDLGPQGRKIGQLPEEFDRDEDHVDSEHTYDQLPRHFNQGGMTDEESPEHEASESSGEEYSEDKINEIVDECPEDADKLDELIRKLEEKKQNLSK